jgi:hypothetical protein
MVPKGTQTAGENWSFRDWKPYDEQVWNSYLGKDEELQDGVESELRRLKKQLENAENVIAHLSERVNTYRYRWLEEYYRADNLERHMPCDIDVPVLGQIPAGTASPAFCPELFTWNEGGSEQGDGASKWGDDKLLEQHGTKKRTAPGEWEDYGAEKNLLAEDEMRRT